MDYKLIKEQAGEFFIAQNDLFFVNLLFYTFPFLSHSLLLFPFCKNRSKRHIKRIYEETAIKAYYTDNADIGLFENFMLKKDACVKVVEDHLERDSQWNKSSIVLRVSGTTSGSSCDFEIENSEITTKDKKKRMIQIITEKGKIIPFYKGRLKKANPYFFKKIDKIHTKLFS